MTIDDQVTKRARGHLGRKRPAWERADDAARSYVQGLVKGQTLQQLAILYDVSVADIQRCLDGK